MSDLPAPAAVRQASMFLPTCSICARMSPLPTSLPPTSSAIWPATISSRLPSAVVITTVGDSPRQGGPTTTGSVWPLTYFQASSACLILSGAFSFHPSHSGPLPCDRYSLSSTIVQTSGSTVSLCGAAKSTPVTPTAQYPSYCGAYLSGSPANTSRLGALLKCQRRLCHR